MESGLRGLAAVSAAGRALQAAARALFPHECAGCGAEGEVICERCRMEMRGPRKGLFACPGCGTATPSGASCGARRCRVSPLDGLVSAAPYRDRAWGTLLRQWKYERADDAGRELAAAFGAFLSRHAAALSPIVDGAEVVAVPLSPLRRAIRGFNQCDPLADEVAARFGAARPRVLRRARGGPAQAGIADAEDRAANVSGAFVAAGTVRQGGRWVVVDDVATTGATLRACAAALKKAGAGRVWGITVLRG